MTAKTLDTIGASRTTVSATDLLPISDSVGLLDRVSALTLITELDQIADNAPVPVFVSSTGQVVDVQTAINVKPITRIMVGGTTLNITVNMPVNQPSVGGFPSLIIQTPTGYTGTVTVNPTAGTKIDALAVDAPFLLTTVGIKEFIYFPAQGLVVTR